MIHISGSDHSRETVQLPHGHHPHHPGTRRHDPRPLRSRTQDEPPRAPLRAANSSTSGVAMRPQRSGGLLIITPTRSRGPRTTARRAEITPMALYCPSLPGRTTPERRQQPRYPPTLLASEQHVILDVDVGCTSPTDAHAHAQSHRPPSPASAAQRPLRPQWPHHALYQCQQPLQPAPLSEISQPDLLSTVHFPLPKWPDPWTSNCRPQMNISRRRGPTPTLTDTRIQSRTLGPTTPACRSLPADSQTPHMSRTPARASGPLRSSGLPVCDRISRCWHADRCSRAPLGLNVMSTGHCQGPLSVELLTPTRMRIHPGRQWEGTRSQQICDHETRARGQLGLRASSRSRSLAAHMSDL
ncbi:hypothetical protein OH77DRAFT_243253 [Trametes cingulata]|nr:hypothetical protein OH77DRAFT_243253 [Trametes cingulata]